MGSGKKKDAGCVRIEPMNDKKRAFGALKECLGIKQFFDSRLVNDENVLIFVKDGDGGNIVFFSHGLRGAVINAGQ